MAVGAPPVDDRSVATVREAGSAPMRAVSVRLLALARPHLWRLLGAAICLLLSSAAFLAFPYVVGQLTDSVFQHHDAAALDRVTLTLLLVVLVTAAFGYGRGYLLSYAGNRIVSDLRRRLYGHLQSLSISYYDERHTGDIMSRITADTTLVQTVITDNLLSFVQQILTLVVVVILVLVLEWRLALVTLAVAPVLAVAGFAVGRRMRRLSQQAQEQLGEASTVLEETIGAVRVVKAFGREGYEADRYGAAVERAFAITLRSARLRALFEAVMTTAAIGAVAVVLWFGGHEVLARRLSPGGLIQFLFYLTMLVGPLQGLASLYSAFQQALGGATRIFQVLDTVPDIADAPDAYPLPPGPGRVELRDVRFAYTKEGKEVLRGIDLVAEAGQTVALVGPSGAGKTTLAALLLRFYLPSSGSIRIDGHHLTDVTVASLRAAMAIVPQEATLFGGSVRDNIAYGRLDATDEEIEAAARAANAHDFIVALPHGYDALIGERGVKLSGGQRQRVAIARALLKDPRLLILDEATSALDNESEGLVQEALDRLMIGRTTIIIAHRLSTIERADRIVVLDAGRIVEEGTHAELLARGGLYQRLYTFRDSPTLTPS